MVVELAAVPVTGREVLAQDPTPPPGQGPEFGEASPIALVVVLVLGAALVVLIRSMTKHLRRVPASFDPPPSAPAGSVPPPSGSPGSGPQPSVSHQSTSPQSTSPQADGQPGEPPGERRPAE